MKPGINSTFSATCATGLNNVGTMALAGPNLNYVGAVLNNAGTISHVGTGDLQSDFADLDCSTPCDV